MAINYCVSTIELNLFSLHKRRNQDVWFMLRCLCKTVARGETDALHDLSVGVLLLCRASASGVAVASSRLSERAECAQAERGSSGSGRQSASAGAEAVCAARRETAAASQRQEVRSGDNVPQAEGSRRIRRGGRQHDAHVTFCFR